MTPLLILLGELASAGVPSLHDHMNEHVRVVNQARDAVIRGDFETARGHLRTLAEHELAEGFPPEAKPYAHNMRQLARAGGQAPTLEAVGAAVAQVSLQCGGCHTALGSGPEFAAAVPPSEEGHTKGHMQRHAWASVRMWEGLVQPSRDRWDQGALQLLEEPWVKGKLDVTEVDPQVTRFGERIHRAGMDALMTWSDTERASLYGSLIATCARCHRTIDDGDATPIRNEPEPVSPR